MLPKPTFEKTSYELLPPNLEDLQMEYASDWEAMTFDDNQDLEDVRSNVSKLKSSLPYFKRLIIWHQKDHVQMAEMNGGFLDDTLLEKFRAHEQVYQEFGVKFEWVTVTSFWDTPVGKELDAEGDLIIEKSRDGLSNFPTLHPTSLTV